MRQLRELCYILLLASLYAIPIELQVMRLQVPKLIKLLLQAGVCLCQELNSLSHIWPC